MVTVRKDLLTIIQLKKRPSHYVIVLRLIWGQMRTLVTCVSMDELRSPQAPARPEFPPRVKSFLLETSKIWLSGKLRADFQRALKYGSQKGKTASSPGH